MKTVVAAAIALLAGLFFGGMGPRSELRQVKKELAEAKEAAARARSSAALPLALGMGSLMAAQDRAQAAAAVAQARQTGDLARATINFEAGQTTLGPVAIAPAPKVYEPR